MSASKRTSDVIDATDRYLAIRLEWLANVLVIAQINSFPYIYKQKTLCNVCSMRVELHEKLGAKLGFVFGSF